MKKFLLVSVITLSCLSVVAEDVDKEKCYTEFSQKPKRITVDEFKDALKQYPDLLSWQGEAEEKEPLAGILINAKNKTVLIAIAKGLMSGTMTYEGQTGMEAVDKVAQLVHIQGVKNLFLRTAQKADKAQPPKPKPDIVAHKPGWFSLKNILGGSAVVLGAYSCWKLYKRFYGQPEK